MRLGEAKEADPPADELEHLGRIPLLIVDEVGYIPFDPEAASLLFSLISCRYERSSLIVSSNKSFSPWAEILRDGLRDAASTRTDIENVLALWGSIYIHLSVLTVQQPD